MGLVRQTRVTLRLTCAVFLAQCVALAAAEPPAAETRKPAVPELKVEKYTLRNGLTVILHEDHKTPLVAVNILYKVGSKDDPPRLTGLAHLVEHLMFEGSEHCDESYYWPVYRYYTEAQGATSEDRTVYYTTLTNNALELALWLEADRMAFLLPVITNDKLEKQRDVVKNERREKLDDRPFGQVEEALLEALYPPGHPYRHSIIGSMADLSAVSLADVSASVQKYYVPNNALLCLAGDFEPGQARRLIEKYFGPLLRGPLAAPAKPAETTLPAARHVALFDRVSHGAPVSVADGAREPSRRARA